MRASGAGRAIEECIVEMSRRQLDTSGEWGVQVAVRRMAAAACAATPQRASRAFARTDVPAPVEFAAATA